MPIFHVNSDDFDKEVLKSEQTVLVDFWASWCGPCRAIAPILDEVAEEVDDTIKICKVDVDESTDLAQEYGVMSIPTLIVFKNGEIVNQHVGGASKDGILDLLGL